MSAAKNHESHTNEAELYAKIEQAIGYLETHSHDQPDLQAVAAQVGLSTYYFQRVFKRLAGISPKRFLQHTTLEQAKTRLRANHPVLDVAYDVGLSGAGRLHDLFIQGEAVTPGTFKTRGEQLTIRHGVHPTPFGYAFVAITPHGICELNLRTHRQDAEHELERAKRQWKHATWQHDHEATAASISQIFENGQVSARHLPMHLRGTNFQLKVWQAVLQIPEGSLTTYSDLAQAVGCPAAVRAVGSAVGDNHLAYLIPCHRVLRKDGGIGGYATGLARKQAMLAYEALAIK
jgi:AraC family transcriptional regulator of adaptative response/methylated-DNA-[protein]-cysteine methyltransferase